jgi:predicted phage terminase large subunit-like protein
VSAVVDPLAAIPWIAIKAERARRSFRYFFEHFAWPALLPGVTFVPNWHIDSICEHLQAISEGKIRKLIINMPFRMLKSTLVSQAWQAWEWIDHPELQYLTASYARDLAIRDAVATRKIIDSKNYQASWGNRWRLSSDQNVKSRFDNTRGGARTVTSTDSAATGFGGHRRIIDDPISPKEANSALAILTSIDFWRGTMATRSNDPENDAAVIVHQRLHEKDLTGYLLAEERGWEHLVFPMRYEPENTKTTSLGFHDPRTKEGELLFPVRVGEMATRDLEKSLGQYHTNAQLQQRPEPRGGIILQRKHYRFWKALPADLDEVVISVDCTFKDLQTSDYVAIHAWGNKGANKYLLRRLKERLNFKATCDAIKSMNALFPDCIATLIEDKANGSAVIETLSSEVSGVIPVNPDGGKAARAYAMQPEHEAGNIWLPDPSIDPEIEVFLSASSSFTGMEGGDDDEIDAMTQYCNWRRVRDKSMGLQQWMAAKAEEVRRQRQTGEPARQ